MFQMNVLVIKSKINFKVRVGPIDSIFWFCLMFTKSPVNLITNKHMVEIITFLTRKTSV